MPVRIVLASMLLLSAVVAAPLASAQQSDTRAAAERLFREEPAKAEWFSPSFLNEIPLREIDALLKRLTDQYGEVQEVTGDGESFSVQLESAEVPATIQLDPNGRIASLLLHPPVPTAGSLEDHVGAIAALPGETSVLVLSDGDVRATHNPDAVLAVGSAAKLAILKALDEAVAAGRLAWDEVVRLDPKWRSLPAGILQDWPEGTPLTIATLANLMISISDNTATEALIDIVGR
jgi:beta-lactamase class A